jgi:hypothetical protein
MTLGEIHQFEKNAESIMVGVLGDICQNVYRSRQVDVNQSPRLSVKAVIGAQFQNQKLNITEAPGFIYSAYECGLQVTVTTNRTTDEKSDFHNALLGQTRMQCSQFYVDAWQEEQPDALPNLITQLKPAQNDDDVADTEDLDNSKLTFTFILVINPQAFPFTQ